MRRRRRKSPKAYCIKDIETVRVVQALADEAGISMVEAIRRACERDLAAERSRRPLAQRLRPLVRELAEARRPQT
jgi:hypothetical protein